MARKCLKSRSQGVESEFVESLRRNFRVSMNAVIFGILLFSSIFHVEHAEERSAQRHPHSPFASSRDPYFLHGFASALRRFILSACKAVEGHAMTIAAELVVAIWIEIVRYMFHEIHHESPSPKPTPENSPRIAIFPGNPGKMAKTRRENVSDF